jgi:hypothetical protein
MIFKKLFKLIANRKTNKSSQDIFAHLPLYEKTTWDNLQVLEDFIFIIEYDLNI